MYLIQWGIPSTKTSVTSDADHTHELVLAKIGSDMYPDDMRFSLL